MPARAGRNVLEGIAIFYEVRPSLIYKAMQWSRQRYFQSLKGKKPIPLPQEKIAALAEALNITPLQLKGFLAEYYFG